MPGEGAERDGYGNVTRGQLVAVLRELGRDYSPGYQQVISRSAARRLKAMKRHGWRYIVVRPGARVSPGIYERGSDRRLKMVLAFKRAATYQRRLSLTDTRRFDVVETFDAEFNRAINEHIARLARSR